MGSDWGSVRRGMSMRSCSQIFSAEEKPLFFGDDEGHGELDEFLFADAFRAFAD